MPDYPTYQQPPAYQPPPAPRKRRHPLRWIFGGAFLVIVIIVIVTVASAAGGAANDVNQHLNASHTVTYQVSGTAKQASVDYSSDGNGNQAQEDPVHLPWTKTLTMKGDIAVSLEAQNKGSAGTITCTTKVDGKVTSTNTSKGQFAVVTCG